VTEARWHQVCGLESNGCLWHTAVHTASDEILVFGGCTSDIFSTAEPQKHSNNLLRFRLSPKSLTGLTMDVVFEHRLTLSSEWQDLPKCLSVQLSDRLLRLRQAEEQARKYSQTVDVPE